MLLSRYTLQLTSDKYRHACKRRHYDRQGAIINLLTKLTNKNSNKNSKQSEVALLTLEQFADKIAGVPKSCLLRGLATKTDLCIEITKLELRSEAANQLLMRHGCIANRFRTAVSTISTFQRKMLSVKGNCNIVFSMALTPTMYRMYSKKQPSIIRPRTFIFQNECSPNNFLSISEIEFYKIRYLSQ